MYFLSGEETKWLLKHLIPRVRETGVAEELRGWNWHQPPLDPPYAVKLAVYEVAGKYCSSARDLFLRRVAGMTADVGKAARAGSAYHSAVAQVIQEAKRLIYAHGPQGIQLIGNELRRFVPRFESRNGAEPDHDIVATAHRLVSFEAGRMLARIEDVLSRQPYIAADSLVASALPITCEHKLDGSFLGMSSLVSCDAASLGSTVIFDTKFGRKRDFHRLSATGYALVMESLWEFPVDVGCTVYVDTRSEVPTITRDLYAIDDELRQWFIDERDDKMRIVAEQMDPGLADECYEYCGFVSECRGGMHPAGN
jgi:CRISPR-associated protein Csa1